MVRDAVMAGADIFFVGCGITVGNTDGHAAGGFPVRFSRSGNGLCLIMTHYRTRSPTIARAMGALPAL